ncbi:hypothetical protein QUF76_11525 [Desulfobacterales bacterium HSG16]|nr:hypothetical protein [Desulfobacterales bacterium HSG16]
MNESISREHLTDELRKIYSNDPNDAQCLIEKRLEQEFSDFSTSEKMVSLDNLTKAFEHSVSDIENMGEDQLLEIFSRLIGRNLSSDDLLSGELLQRLAEALGAIFTSLNKIVKQIDDTFNGGNTEGITILSRVQDHMKRDKDTSSIEIYLDQINQSFLVAHKAFQYSGREVIKTILDELDPEQIKAAGGSRLLGKGKYFNTFEEKYERCKKWFDSERSTEDLLREFEKQIVKLSKS